MALVVLAMGAGACKRERPAEAKAEGAPMTVRVTKVTTRTLQRIVDSVGTLYPFDEVIISAEIEGRVEKVNFDLGDEVKAGDVLCIISDEEQRYLLAQNEAQLRQSLERLGLKNEKDRVKDIQETPEVRRARADLMEAEQRHRRMENLVDQKIGAVADLDQARARLLAAQAAYDATLNQTRNLIQEVERFKAVVSLQRKKLRDTTVRAPFAAAIKERQVTVGQFARPNTPLFSLVKINPVRLRLEIPERMAPLAKIGQPAQVSVEAYGDRIFQGKIWRVSPTVDQSKRTFIVEVLIDNPNGELKPGSYARARVITDKVDEVRVVPVRAVIYLLGSNKAFVVRDGVVEARDLKLGDRLEQQVEVLEGLQAGEVVALDQLSRLDSGVKVQASAGGLDPRKQIRQTAENSPAGR